MKKLVIALLVLSLLFAGCAKVPMLPAPEPLAPEPLTPGVVLHKEPPEDMTWISPGKVQVGNFYPGARAEWELLVHNGKNKTAEFIVKYRYPSHVEEDYWNPPLAAQDWVIIADATPVIAPKETREILIVLAMPTDIDTDVSSVNWVPPKWEFWVSVMEVGGVTGAMGIHTELCSRWLITMR